LKIENLLAQYLYQHKKLSLPGIGLFTLNDAATLPDDGSKSKQTLEGVSFISKTSGQPEDTLLEFIKKETGKMKALAQADLDSYIELAQQFLNIGKPFYLEGIGTLNKKRDGSIDFNVGTALPPTSIKQEEEEPKKKSSFAEEKNSGSSASMRGLVLALGIIGTIAVIAGGGYYLYTKNTDNDLAASTSIQPVADSQVSKNITPDTTAAAPPATTAATTPLNGYKFILETTDKKTRALKRYDMIKTARVLRSYGDSRIQMETKDSSNFKIYIVLNCPPQDTTRYKDSLNAWYYGLKSMKVKIE